MVRTFDETYTMRSRFFQLLGEAGKMLANAYREADAENQAAIKELAFDAMKHWLVENYRYPADEIARPEIDPLDLLAFFAGRMDLPSKESVARWPEWSAKATAAVQRYAEEERAFQVSRQTDRGGSSDPMVSSHQDAVHHWVYLPLIRAALAQATGTS